MTAHAQKTTTETTETTTETTHPTQHGVVTNAVKLLGETFIPGASLLLDGKILQGGAHVVVGAVASALLGPVGLAVVIANSFSKSTTGKNLLKQFSTARADRAQAAAK